MSLAFPGGQPAFFEHFLNPKNHKPGIPLDFISYHFYAVPTPDQGTEVQPHVFFAQADGFLNTVRYVESIRKRLSPATRTTINEIGSIAADDLGRGAPGYVFKPIPGLVLEPGGSDVRLPVWRADAPGRSMWRGSRSSWAIRPSSRACRWWTGTNGKPNPRYWVLKLLKDNFGPGDKLVETKVTSLSSTLWASRAATANGGCSSSTSATATSRSWSRGRAGARQDYVDLTTKFDPPSSAKVEGEKITLRGLAVVVVTLP